MRCSKCHKKLTFKNKFCPKCGAAVPSEQKRKARIRALIVQAVATLIVAAACVFYYFYINGNAAGQTRSNNDILLILISLTFFSVVCWLISLIRFAIRRLTTKLIFGAVIIFVIGAGYLSGHCIYQRLDFKMLPSTLSLIQELLAETAATKEIGDTLASGQKDIPASYSWQNVEIIADNMVSQVFDLSLFGSYRLNDYKDAVLAWAEKIRDGAKDLEKWKEVPEEPAEFAMTLKEKEAEELYRNSLVKIFDLIQFGTDAIERGDKETMRYIAAKLLVQAHWLEGLANYKKAGTFVGLVGQAEAAEENPILNEFEKARQREQEYVKVHSSVRTLMLIALEYHLAADVQKDKVLAQKWLERAEDTIAFIMESDLGAQVLTELDKYSELLKSRPNRMPIPPKVQAFKDDCLAKKGELGGLLLDNGYLPATEDGYSCRFRQGDMKCWKFLSYSGSIASGGEGDCEKENILSRANGPNVALKEKQTQEQQAPKTTAAPAAPKPAPTPKPAAPAPVAPKPTIEGELGQPTGTGAPKIEFTLSQSVFNATVGEHFSYSFCQPDLARSSSLCTTAATNPRYGLPPYTFYVESGGFLPFGLTLNLNGLLEGTPTAAGSRTVGICVKDTGGFNVCHKATINVAARPVAENNPPAEEAVEISASVDSINCEIVNKETFIVDRYIQVLITQYTYRVTASGKATGPVGIMFGFNVDTAGESYLGSEGGLFNPISWTGNKSSRSNPKGSVSRAEGDPAATAWTLDGGEYGPLTDDPDRNPLVNEPFRIVLRLCIPGVNPCYLFPGPQTVCPK